MQSLARYHHLTQKLAAHSCLPYWKDIVGDEIAAVSAPERISKRSVLIVRVNDAVWAQELTLQKESLLRKIAERGEGAPLNDIQFVVGGPKRARKASGS